VKKKLSPEDLTLWKVNTRDVKRLHKEKNIEVIHSSSHEAKIIDKGLPQKKSSINPVTPKSLPSSLGRKDFRHFKIEAQLDLHGYTLKAAYQALEDFLLWAQEKRIKGVLIITGKGSLSAKNTLRHSLPQWIEDTPLRNLVLSLHHPAKVQDGGTGAFYMEVRRKRKLHQDLKTLQKKS